MTDMIKGVQDVVSNNFILKVGDIAEAVIYALGTPETVEVCIDKIPINKTLHTVTSRSKIIATHSFNVLYINLVPTLQHLYSFYFVSNVRYCIQKYYLLRRYINSYNSYNNYRAR